MNKIYIYAITVISIGIILTVILYFTIFNFKHIEDKNGDLTNLVTIDLSDLDVLNNSKYGEKFSSFTYDGNTSRVSNDLKNVDYDYIKFQAKKFSGVKVIHATQVETNDKLIIDIVSELKSGNLEIIVLTPNNTIIDSIDVNSEKQVVIDNTIKGTYKVIIGGESAEYKITINRNIIGN